MSSVEEMNQRATAIDGLLGRYTITDSQRKEEGSPV
jgi:hypothetical protein